MGSFSSESEKKYLILKPHQESYQANIFGVYYQIPLAYKYLQDEKQISIELEIF